MDETLAKAHAANDRGTLNRASTSICIRTLCGMFACDGRNEPQAKIDRVGTIYRLTVLFCATRTSERLSCSVLDTITDDLLACLSACFVRCESGCTSCLRLRSVIVML